LVWNYEYVDVTANPGFAVKVINAVSPREHFAGGAQPQYYDQLAAVYYEFRVLSSAISVEAYAPQAAHRIAVRFSATATTPTSMFDALQAPHTKSCICSTSGNRAVAVLSHSFTAPQLWGSAWTDNDAVSTTAANAAFVGNWEIVTQPVAAAQAAVTVRVRLVSEVAMSSRVVLEDA
jgi:hypothetical protein